MHYLPNDIVLYYDSSEVSTIHRIKKYVRTSDAYKYDLYLTDRYHIKHPSLGDTHRLDTQSRFSHHMLHSYTLLYRGGVKVRIDK